MDVGGGGGNVELWHVSKSEAGAVGSRRKQGSVQSDILESVKNWPVNHRHRQNAPPARSEGRRERRREGERRMGREIVIKRKGAGTGDSNGGRVGN